MSPRQGQISLTEIKEISPQIRERLSKLWIENVDELCAIFAVPAVKKHLSSLLSVNGEEFSGMGSMVANVLPQARRLTLQSPRAGGSLGYVMDPSLVQEITPAGIVRKRDTLPEIFERKFPASVNLIPQMREIKNQGERGTCVSFSCIALREFLEGSTIDFSEQFCYWACKQIDGLSAPGTYLRTGMTVLKEMGVCTSKTWHYVPAQIDGNEAHHPPPDGAEDEAKQYRIASVRTVEPGFVENYKHVLSGSGGEPPSPIPIAVLVFNSWYLSPQTHHTGKITMPLPDEPYIGGHAMCVVGYQDDKGVPGGGFFIVRNSWGLDWASESPVARGYGMLPYAYVERYALEAFSAIGGVKKVSVSKEDEFSPYIHILEKDDKDRKGKSCYAGTPVLFDSGDPRVFETDSPDARVRFKARDFTWLDETRQKRWFPEWRDTSGDFCLPEDFRNKADTIKGLRGQFIAGVSKNISDSLHSSLPILNLSPIHRFFLGESKIRGIIEHNDFQDVFYSHLKNVLLRSKPDTVNMTGEWDRNLRQTTQAKIFEVKSWFSSIHVVSCCFNPLKLKGSGKPEWCVADQTYLDVVFSAYSDWHIARKNLRTPKSIFFTVGIPDGWNDAIKPFQEGERWVTLSKFQELDKEKEKIEWEWKSEHPPRRMYRLSIRDFTDLIEPVTLWGGKFSKVKSWIDEALEATKGLMTLEKVTLEKVWSAFKRRVRRSCLKEMFLKLDIEKDYTVCETQDIRKIYIREATEEERKKEPRASNNFIKFIRRHGYGLIVTAFGIALVKLSAKYALTKQGVYGFICAVIAGYLTSRLVAWITERVQRLQEKD